MANFLPLNGSCFFCGQNVFWQVLTTLAEVDCEETMEMLRQKVRPLNASEVLAAFTENLRWYRQWWEQNGGGPTEAELLQLVRESLGTPGPM